MKVLMINSVCGIRSTGRICTDIAEELERLGHEVKIAYGRDTVPEKYQKYAVKIGTNLDVKLHGLKTRLFDRHGFGSTRATKKFIQWVKEYDPDVIHLHNLHGYYINIEVLFHYLKTANKKVFWSLYDCWSITGHCAHFDFNQCSLWKSECRGCKFSKEYPKSHFSMARKNYFDKKRIFNSVADMTIVVPSNWMYGLFQESYLSTCNIEIIPSGIDLTKFHNIQSDIKARFNITDKKVVLGVASTWVDTKGIEYINRLAIDLPMDKYARVVIGRVPNYVNLSNRIIHISETHSIEELCCWYSCADVFVNPTLQESQGLTTIEALACGTPAVVFNSGGAAECLDDECGIVVAKGDYDAFIDAIVSMCERGITVGSCKTEKYDKRLFVRKYIDLYNGLSYL